MKRADITPKTLLAYRRGQYGSYDPMVVVETKTLWTRRKQATDGGTRTRLVLTPAPKHTRYRASDWSVQEVGFLVIQAEGADKAAADAMREAIGLIPDELTEQTIADLNSELPKGLTLKLVNNAHLHGDYDEFMAKQKAADERNRQAHKAKMAKEQADREKFQTVLAALKERGLDPGPFATQSNGRMSVSLDTLGALLGLDDEPKKTA